MKQKAFLRLVHALVFTLGLGGQAHAQTFTWTGGGGDKLWSSDSNWAGNSAPVSANNTWLMFQGGAFYYDPALNDMADPFDLAILSFGNLSGEFYLGGGDLNFVGTAYTPAIEHQSSNATAGINNNVHISTGIDVLGNGSVLRFGGTVTNDSTGSIYIGRGANTYTAFDSDLLNSGMLYVSSGTVGIWGAVSGTGSVSVFSSLLFSGGAIHNFNAGSSITGYNGSTIRFEGGQTNFNFNGTGVSTAGLVQINGAALGGSGDFIIDASAGNFDWRSGIIDGTADQSAIIKITNGILEGVASTRLIERNLTFQGIGAQLFWNGGHLNLAAGAGLTFDGVTITASSLAENITAADASNTVTFVNSSLSKSGTSTMEIQPYFSFDESSAINVAEGKIRFTGGGTSAAYFNTGSNTTIEFAGGTYDFSGTRPFGSTIAGGIGHYLISGGRVNINNDFAVINGGSTLTLTTGGTLGGSSSFTQVAGFGVNWTGGMITGDAGTAINLGAVVISGTDTKTVDTRVVSLGGTWSGGDILVQNGGTFALNGLIITGDNSISSTGPDSRLGIQGFIVKNGSSGTTTFSAPLTLTSGQIQALTGKILLTGGGTSPGFVSFVTAAGGTVEFGGGTYDLLGNFGTNSNGGDFLISAGRVNLNSITTYNAGTVLTLTAGGTLGGSASSYTMAGTGIRWTGGMITGVANSTASFTAATVLSGTDTKTLDTRRVNLSGTWTRGDIVLQNSATLGLGTFTVQSDETLSVNDAASRVLVNGVITKNTTTGTTTISAPLLLNAGQIRAHTGKILLTGGGTSSGGGVSFVTIADGTIEFGGGTYDLLATFGTDSTGGNFLISGGRVNLNITTSYNLGTGLTLMTGGTLGGSANGYTMTGTSIRWTGGTITGAVGSTALFSTQTAISGADAKTLDGRSVSMSAVWTGGDIILQNSATFNLSNSVIQTDNSISRTDSVSRLVTNGPTVKNTTSGTTLISTPILVNAGYLRADTGKILLTGGGTGAGNFLTGGGGTMEFGEGTYDLLSAFGTNTTGGSFIVSGGRVNINNTASQNVGTGFTLTAGGTLGGTASFYEMTGTSIRWTGGTITGAAGSSALFSTATVISGTDTKTLDTRNVFMSGIWTGGNIALQNSATLTTGNMIAQSNNSLTGAGAFVANGNFIKNTATGTTTIDVAFTNNNLTRVDDGVLLFTNNVTNNGSLVANDGGTLAIDAYVVGGGGITVLAGGALIGSGTISNVTSVSGTLSPGHSPGELTFEDSVTFEDGSTYLFDLGAYEDDQTGIAGTDWDLLNFTGSADLIFETSSLRLNFDDIANPNTFNPFWASEGQYSWLIASVDSGTLDFSGLSISNAEWDTGYFTLSNVDNDLYLNFVSTVPEPGTFLLLAIGGAALLARRRRTAI